MLKDARIHRGFNLAPSGRYGPRRRELKFMSFEQVQEWEKAIGDTLTRALSVARRSKVKHSNVHYSCDHIQALGRGFQSLNRTPVATPATTCGTTPDTIEHEDIDFVS